MLDISSVLLKFCVASRDVPLTRTVSFPCLFLMGGHFTASGCKLYAQTPPPRMHMGAVAAPRSL